MSNQIPFFSLSLPRFQEHELGIAMSVKIQFSIVAAIFDYNPKISTAMKPEYWEKLMPALEKLLEDLHANAENLSTSDQVCYSLLYF